MARPLTRQASRQVVAGGQGMGIQGSDEFVGEELPWQEWTGLAGVAMDGWSVVCPADRYLDLAGETTVELHTELLTASGASLQIQTAFSMDGPWRTVVGYAAATDTSLVLSSAVESPYELARYLRWEILAHDTWDLHFRIGVSSDTGMTSVPSVDASGAGRAGIVEMAPWTDYRVAFTASTLNPIIQDREMWLETGVMRFLALETEAILLSGATLVLERAFSEEGPWTTIAAYTMAYTLQSTILSWDDSGGEPALGGFVRWHLEGATAGFWWNACFRIRGKWS